MGTYLIQKNSNSLHDRPLLSRWNIASHSFSMRCHSDFFSKSTVGKSGENSFTRYRHDKYHLMQAIKVSTNKNKSW